MLFSFAFISIFWHNKYILIVIKKTFKGYVNNNTNGNSKVLNKNRCFFYEKNHKLNYFAFETFRL